MVPQLISSWPHADPFHGYQLIFIDFHLTEKHGGSKFLFSGKFHGFSEVNESSMDFGGGGVGENVKE